MVNRCSECLTKFDDTVMDDSIRVFQCTICKEICHEECVHRHTWIHLKHKIKPMCMKCGRLLKSKGKDRNYMICCPLCSFAACRLCVAQHVRKKHWKELYNKYVSYKNFVAEKI